MKLFKTILVITLAFALMITPVGLSYAESGNTDTLSATNTLEAAEIKNKNEVVYATLESGGSTKATYTVNHFKVTKAGSLTDYGNYSSVLNLTTSEPMIQSSDTITTGVQEGDFYYQGNQSQAWLPWKFDIIYLLDGVIILPKELAGKSGKLEIQIKTSRNDNVDSTFYDNYMLQISLTLDSEKCDNIEAPDATIAEAGKSKLLNFTVLPGKDADFSVSTTVQDFEMTGINISAIPFTMSFELPNTDGMTDKFTQLSDALASLNDGVGKLADGVGVLKDGAAELQDGSSGINIGLSELSSNSEQLTNASAQIKDALSQISSAINSGTSPDLSDMSQLPQGLRQMAEGLKQISGGLTELNNGFSPAYTALDKTITGIPDTVITEQEFSELYANTTPDQFSVLNTLKDNYIAAQTVKGTYPQVKAAFDAVGLTIENLSGSIDTVVQNLETMAQGIETALSNMDALDQLSQLNSGLNELSENYGKFHKGLLEYTDGVKQLAAGYTEFDSGIDKFSGGISDLKNGVDGLHEGTEQLKDETSKLPDTIQEEIDKMMSSYLGKDFKPVSFTSSKNEHVNLVQFVLKCDGIEKQKLTDNTQPQAQEKETIWDRFLALFKG